MTGLLEVRNLRKAFQVKGADGLEELVALEDLSFDLARGSSLAVVGESGSGKTTLARIIAGLQPATSGSVTFDGKPLAPPRRLVDRIARAREIQMVFQDPFGSLDPIQRLGSSLEEILNLHYPGDRAWRRRRVDELLEQVGLSQEFRERTPRSLSGGQRQRFAIAKAIALEPRLIVLDECVSALDVSVQAQVLNLLSDLRQALGISYLFVSHDLAVVRQVCDQCLVMQFGKLVEMGPTQLVLNAPQEPYTKSLLAAVPRPGWRPSKRTQVHQ
ncbi:ABC transporter ATP-binding protein [Mesorhizobium intechi]|uniref:ABC transporter ATP-binding protein n=1 Tax=Mesorhizobium intechi TaxID=537601 RepID=A0A8T9AWD0_9HYPH|nr:ATP-binding cassette domain-containing protein [Mesorhizobium intechi]TSE13414.1 ABC transporter ATP-binding protein [Mesorhizobium intechi]